MKDFVIVIAGDSSVFYPGQVVSGSVVCENSVPKNFKEIKIRFEGRVDISLPGARYIENALTGNSVNKASKSYFNQSMTIWTKGQQQGATAEDQQFPAGIQTMPFSFRIPQNVPPSFTGIWGTIKYFLEAKIYKEGKLKQDSVTTCMITIANAVLVDARPSGVSLEVQSTPGGVLCCASNPIVMTGSTPRKGYCIYNEVIPIKVHIENGSIWSISNVEVYIEKRIVFNTGGSNQMQTAKQSRKYRNLPILRRSSGDYEVSLVVEPNNPPTLISEFIKINYFVCVLGIVNHHPNMLLEIPITLGNAVSTNPQPTTAPPTHQPYMTRMDSIQQPPQQQQLPYQPAYLPRTDSTSVPYSPDPYPYQPYPQPSAHPPQPYPVPALNMPLEPHPHVDHPPPYPSAPPQEEDRPYSSATAPPPPPPGGHKEKGDGHIENGTMVTVGNHTFEYMAFTG